MSLSAVIVVAPAAVLLGSSRDSSLQKTDLALLLFHEEVHQQDLLLVDLEADVFGDVRY